MIGKTGKPQAKTSSVAGVLSVLTGLMLEGANYIGIRNRTPSTRADGLIGVVFLALGGMWFAIAARQRRAEEKARDEVSHGTDR